MTLPDIVRLAQHALLAFLVLMPLIVMIPGVWRPLKALPLRIAHLVLLGYAGINALLGNLSHLSVLEWELRDAAAGSESSWFLAPISDLAMLRTRLGLSTPQFAALFAVILLLTVLTFVCTPSERRHAPRDVR